MFGSIISTLVVNAVKTTVKSSIRIDELINKLKEACPPQQELQKIINQKNQLSQTLGLVQTNLTTLNNIVTPLDTIINTINTSVTIIKSLPTPVAIGGVGVPMNLILKLSDTLEKLKDLIQQGKISIKGAQQAFGTISTNIATVQNKLNQLDAVVLVCATQTGFTGSLSDGTSGVTSNPLVNVNLNEELENRLSPNSTNPLTYKGWRLILQTDPNNKFSFPRRRVIAQKTNPNGKGIITLFSDFGLSGAQGYSYSSDTQVLVNDIKFKIDNPNWKPDSVLEVLDEIEAQAEAAAAEAARQAEEAKRGRVIFYKGFYFDFPLGNPAGYTEGEYPSVSAEGIVDILDSREGISSIKVGRGLRLIIYPYKEFSFSPFNSNDYKVFEHPLSSENEYLEIPDLGEFNDRIKSFKIQNLVGGLVTTEPAVPVPQEGILWALKRQSFATLRNSSYEWVQGPIKAYDIFIKKDGSTTSEPPNSQNYTSYAIAQGSSIQEAKDEFFDTFNLNEGNWGLYAGENSGFWAAGNKFENVLYKTLPIPGNIGMQSFQNRLVFPHSLGTYETIDNGGKVHYAVKIS